MNQSEENYAYLIRKIDDFIRKFYLNKVLKGGIFLATSFFAAYIVVAFAEYFGNFDPAIRTLLFYSFVLSNAFVLMAYVILPLSAYFRLGKVISHEQASAIIGEHFQPVRDKLLNTLQLKKLSESNPDQRELIDASIQQKAADLRPIPFSSAVKLGENKKYLKYALLPLAVIIIVSFSAPSILGDSTERLIHYNKKFIKKAPFSFEVLNKDLNALQGDDFVLNVKLSGNEIPADVYLEDGKNSFKLEKESLVRFSHQFKNLQKDKVIRLRGGEFESDEIFIKVSEKPTLLNFDVYLDYPVYLNKPNEKLQNTGDLTVPEGTRLSWTFKTRSSEELGVIFNKTRLKVKPAQEGVFRFSHLARKSIIYQIRPLNKHVLATDSVGYQIRTIPDLSPIIEVSEKPDSVNNKVLYFMGQVSDDHGFTRLNFNYRVLPASGASEPETKSVVKTVSFDKTNLQSNFFHIWNVDEAQAKPGDQIEYYFEIFDNDGVNGAKSAKSVVRTFKLATEREIAEKFEANSARLKEKMTDAIKKSAQLEKDAKKITQDILDKKNLSYDDKKQIEALLEKQKEIEELVKEIQKENRHNLFEQKQNNQQREEILEKQKQIEDLFNNILDEKTRELLKNIEKLLEKNNKNLTREELSKMQLDNKSLQKELDRILELYKQLEFDQKMTEAIDKLRETAEKQKELAKETTDPKQENEALQAKQEDLKKQFDNIKESLKDLEKKDQALEQKNDFQNPKKEQEQIEQQQQESQKNLQQKNNKKAAENQQEAGEKMQKLADKLEEMQNENEEEESEVNIKALRDILDNLVTSSFDQEKTMQTVRGTSINDPGYLVQTQKQNQIKDNLKMIEDSLTSLSRKVPQIQSAVAKEMQAINFNVGKAIESLAERRTAEANRSQQFAMTSINNLALMLNEALEHMQDAKQNGKPGSKGKKRQSLSQLTKMQEQLNKNMQKAREQMQQQGQQRQQGQQQQGQGMSEQLARMAREQQMIRQAMQEINRMENKDGKASLGNLNELLKEMEQTETDLVNKRIQQETMKRQQEILSKLLDAERADREREQDEKRESKEGQSTAPDYKVILQEFQKVKQRETDLLKTVPPSLNSFYKIKVGDYFKYLNSGYK